MNIVTPSAEYINSEKVNPYKFIESIGRTCYKSESNITDDSAIKFVTNLIKNQHMAMVEHASIIFTTNHETATNVASQISELLTKPYVDFEESMAARNINITINPDGSDKGNYISGSFRMFKNIKSINIFDNILNETYPEIFYEHADDQEFNCNLKILPKNKFIEDVRNTYSDPETCNRIIMEHSIHSIRCVCDRGVTHELVRHRTFVYAQESTRYCNYSKDKFNNEITFIKPCYYADDSEEMKIWMASCQNDEDAYNKLISLGSSPEKARGILGSSLKTEIIITGNELKFQHLVNLRYHGTTGMPHPQMKELMDIVYPIITKESDYRIK